MDTRRYTCRTVRNMLPLHAGRDLDPRHAPAVDAHLRTCLGCFREYRELVAMRGRLGVLAEDRLPGGILDGFTEEVMARIAVGEPGPAAEVPRSSGAFYSLPRLTAAAALLLVCLAGWRLLDDGAALTPDQLGGRSAGGAQGLRAVDDPIGARAFPRPVPQLPAPAPVTPGAGARRVPDGSLRGQALIILETGPVPSVEDELLLEVNREGADGLPRPAGGLSVDDPDKQPRPRRP